MLLHVSATFIMYNTEKCVTVSNFMANHNNRIIIFFSIFEIFTVVPFVFEDRKLAIEFTIEPARLCFR